LSVIKGQKFNKFKIWRETKELPDNSDKLLSFTLFGASMSYKASLIIGSLLLQSCTMNFPSWNSRTPASVADFEALVVKLKDFRARTMGTETDAKCSDEQIDADFKNLMASLKRDSCSKDNFSVDKNEFQTKACPKVKKEGYFDKVIKQTIREEKEKKALSFFQNKWDPDFDYFNMEAKSFNRNINTFMANENYPIEDRAKLLSEYVYNVLMPMRDLVIIKRSYLPQEADGREVYLNLQPKLTNAFVQSMGDSEKNIITQGPNPGSDPFYMEVIEAGNGYALAFSPTDIIRHDVVTLLKAPTTKNYVMALKWMTLHMMMSQIYLYETILGNRGKMAIPTSCQNHFNGNLPPYFNFTFEDGVGEQFLENILSSHGLTYKEDDSSYIDYYIENESKDPTKDGYSGVIPFEQFKNAKMSLNPQYGGGLDSQFDDVAHFSTIMQFKQNEAEQKFVGKIGKQKVIYEGAKTFQDMLKEFSKDEIADITLGDGTVKQIYPGKQNVSQYMLGLMQQHGLIDYTQLITERMKKKFVTKKVHIEFPSMYSSPVWRDWSLKVLADTLHQYRDLPANSEVSTTVNMACNVGMVMANNEMRQICSKGNRLQNLADFLAEFRSGEKYIPTRRLEERKFQNVYPMLTYIWTQLRNNTELLAEAKPFELNFLLDQMAAGNPWARLKMSYMIALDQLEYQREGIPPAFDYRGFTIRKVNNQAYCDRKLVDTSFSKITEAGKVLGLDKTLNYNHAARVLSRSEKTQVWRNVYDDFQQKNAQLFSVKSGNRDFYQMAEELSYKTVLSKDAALKTNIKIGSKAQEEINKVSNSVESQLATFFLKLYQLKDPEKQAKLFEEFSKVNGIDNTFALKLNFLALDDSYKKPIYKDLLKQAALARKMQITQELGRFCAMSVNDVKDFKQIFYSTTKAQNELNQMAGLPSVPPEVMEKINEMSPDEWRDMWWGIGSGIAGMAAIVVGGACTTVTGGICAPLGGAMAVAGLASLGIQVKLTANELGRKGEADVAESQIKIMEDLGFTNTGTSDEVHRSYAWAAFEAISIFPLIGVATRSVKLGPKLVYASTQSLIRKTGKASFRAAAKSATQEEEVRAARFLIGMDGVTQNAGIDSKTLTAAKTKIEKIRQLYTSGEIDLETMIKQIGKVIDPIKKAKFAIAKTVRKEIGKVTVKESAAQIDAKTASMITDYFGDNPKEMLRLIQGYSGERLNKSVRIMNEINATTRIGKRIPIYSGVRDWFMRMRNETLAKNAANILRMEKELTAMGSNPHQLNAYVSKNIDAMTDLFMEIPFRKREIPNFVLAQGMPDFNFYKGRKIPLLSMMSEGQTLKRIFVARARLVHESYKASARQALKLKRFVQSETTLGAFNSFKLSVAELASKKTGAESAKVLADYRRVEETITRKLYIDYMKAGNKLEYKVFKEIVMNPADLKQKAMAEAIWENVPADQLLNMKEVGEFAHRAVKELSTYTDIDSFERYLSALKVLTINRNAAVLEIM
jgi:hypothetical protein